jgi:hypothetical protein
MEKSEEYRRFVRECLEIAGTMDDPQARAVMVQMAHLWFRLAEQHAKSPIWGARPWSVTHPATRTRISKCGCGTARRRGTPPVDERHGETRRKTPGNGPGSGFVFAVMRPPARGGLGGSRTAARWRAHLMNAVRQDRFRR